MGRPSVLSLFTGAGGLDIGLENAGYDVGECVEWDHSSCETLRWNRPAWNVREMDIADYQPAGTYDVVVGGPPCQGFSLANPYHDVNDPRAQMWTEYMRVVAAAKPSVLVMENVPQFFTRKDAGEQRAAGLVNALHDQGFDVRWAVLNAADFGVPQVRKRLIIVAARGLVPDLPVPTHGNGDALGGGLLPHVTVRDAIADLQYVGPAVFHDSSHTPKNHHDYYIAKMAALEPGEKCHAFGTSPRRLYWDRPAFTCTSSPAVHPEEPRSLTPRETARLQDFPDSWFLAGGKQSQYLQVANAVPSRLAEAVGRALLPALGVVAEEAA